jgi:hypothetical protein
MSSLETYAGKKKETEEVKGSKYLKKGSKFPAAKGIAIL